MAGHAMDWMTLLQFSIAFIIRINLGRLAVILIIVRCMKPLSFYVANPEFLFLRKNIQRESTDGIGHPNRPHWCVLPALSRGERGAFPHTAHIGMRLMPTTERDRMKTSRE